MKYISLFTIFVVANAIEYYKVRDDVDIVALVARPGGLKPFVDCYLDKGPCSELSTSFKEMIPESIKQTCARCTDKQKYKYWEFLSAVNRTLPEGYKAFRQYYDPENKYFDALEKELFKYAKLIIK